MENKGISLIWIVVSDLEAAIQFYTETLGFKLHSKNNEYGWAELQGANGCRLGLGQQNPMMELKAGANAVVTITVPDIVKAREELSKKGVRLVGEIMDIPGEVRLQSMEDEDGNSMQLVQLLRK
jgi:predicted enzyme related to lactoylglutathione lyase